MAVFTFSDRCVSSTTPASSRLCLLACSTSPGGLRGFLWLLLNSFVSCSSGSICQSEQRVLVFLLLHHITINMLTFCMFPKTVKCLQSSSLFQTALDLDFSVMYLIIKQMISDGNMKHHLYWQTCWCYIHVPQHHLSCFCSCSRSVVTKPQRRTYTKTWRTSRQVYTEQVRRSPTAVMYIKKWGRWELAGRRIIYSETIHVFAIQKVNRTTCHRMVTVIMCWKPNTKDKKRRRVVKPPKFVL